MHVCLCVSASVSLCVLCVWEIWAHIRSWRRHFHQKKLVAQNFLPLSGLAEPAEQPQLRSFLTSSVLHTVDYLSGSCPAAPGSR